MNKKNRKINRDTESEDFCCYHEDGEEVYVNLETGEEETSQTERIEIKKKVRD